MSMKELNENDRTQFFHVMCSALIIPFERFGC